MSDSWDEANITINGKQLTKAQAMAVRVGIGSFMISLEAEDALGNDMHGRSMRHRYRSVIREVMELIHGATP